MEDLFNMITAFMAQINALFKRVQVLEERTLDEVPSLEAFKALEERYEALNENKAFKGLMDYVELFGLDAEDLTRTLENMHCAALGSGEVEGTVENLGARIKALEGQTKISNRADLKTDDPATLSALESIELFFNMTSFSNEHEGCSLGDYLHHRDILETDYPLSIEEPREGEPLLEEARKAFNVLKAHLIK